MALAAILPDLGLEFAGPTAFVVPGDALCLEEEGLYCCRAVLHGKAPPAARGQGA